MTLDSWVRLFRASKTSGATPDLWATPWMVPVPSRKMGKTSLPLSRMLYSQPRRMTDWPSCWPMVAMVETGAVVADSDIDGSLSLTLQDNAETAFFRLSG